uniref:Uncharacterized protein n=1 Tax=Rhizophora mucronata TaxID=61149 RepID=A0A2P2PS77_RHIMU
MCMGFATSPSEGLTYFTAFLNPNLLCILLSFFGPCASF